MLLTERMSALAWAHGACDVPSVGTPLAQLSRDQVAWCLYKFPRECGILSTRSLSNGDGDGYGDGCGDELFTKDILKCAQ